MCEENLVQLRCNSPKAADVNTGPVCIQMNVSSSDMDQGIIGGH
jgi:hypothetical protein